MKDLFDLTGKVALITGGSRGIGYMMASAYAAAGVKVYISSRKAEVCDAAAEKLNQLGNCVSMPADLSKMEEIERVTGLLKEEEKELHILVNNAGTSWGASVDAFPEKGWDKVFDLNLKSPFFLIQQCLELLTNAATPDDPARVINVTSVDGMHTPIFENFSYAPSKAGLNHLTRMLATHLAPRNIAVNALAPGPFLTEMMQPMVDSMGEEAILKNVPLKRMGGPDDAGGVAIFLAARASAYLTGVVLPVDGGIMAGI